MTTPSAPTGDHGGLRPDRAAHDLAGAMRASLHGVEDGDLVYEPALQRMVQAALDWHADALAAHPVPEPAQVGEVAAVLAEHEPRVGGFFCGCSKGPGEQGAYAEHLAAVLVAAGVTR